MRVRVFGLRLLAAVLTGLWTIAAAIVLLGYRPGGPIDGLVGLATLLPIFVSLLGLFWPPVVRGDRAFAVVAWLGLGAILLLIPSIAGVAAQLLARGPQTLLPSWEAVYPWVLALVATATFGGLGVARYLLGSTAMRRRRLEVGLAVAAVATLVSGSAFAAAAISNEYALRNTSAIASRFGPTQSDAEPPHCTDALATGPTAVVALTIGGDVDGRPIGSVDLRGVRDGDDVSWSADVATEVLMGQFGLVRLDDTTWIRAPREQWRSEGTVPAPSPLATGLAVAAAPTPLPSAQAGSAGADPTQAILARPGLDREVMATALTPGYRSAAEDRGLEFVEGARARHCRIALDGRTFEAAFPAATWMSGHQDLHRWRGALDYWVFMDGQVGQVIANINGEALSLGRDGLQANLVARMTATERGRPVTIQAPIQ